MADHSLVHLLDTAEKPVFLCAADAIPKAEGMRSTLANITKTRQCGSRSDWWVGPDNRRLFYGYFPRGTKKATRLFAALSQSRS
jgi:hypothetical protein